MRSEILSGMVTQRRGDHEYLIEDERRVERSELTLWREIVTIMHHTNTRITNHCGGSTS